MSRKIDAADARPNTYGRLRRIAAWFFRWLYRVEVIYPEREPAEPYLLCSNHLSAMDPVILCCTMRRQQLRFLGKKELFHIPVLGWFLRAIGAFPVDRSGDVGAIRTTVNLLLSGETVGVFPQGTRCAGKPVESTAALVKPGSGLLVVKTGVQVLPVRLVSKDNRVRPFRRVRVIVGEPLRFQTEKLPGERNSEEYGRIAQTIFAEICRLGEETEHHAD